MADFYQWFVFVHLIGLVVFAAGQPAGVPR